MGACLPPKLPLLQFSSLVTFGQGSNRKGSSKNTYDTYDEEVDGGFERLNDAASEQASTDGLYGVKQHYKFNVEGGIPLQKVPGPDGSCDPSAPQQIRVDRTVDVHSQDTARPHAK
ncbi:hypothetical protein GGR56DRAFT_678629 [Xylariaceae sp. FL0804]|nr:hypothetical protein GGR56DRAFT_678629 [Xylariaceae sp. FL0804]